MKIQDFSYHCHSNVFGIFDGYNTTEEMIKQAEKVGFREIGLSNHMCYHPNMILNHKMFFNDFDKALDIYKRNIDEIREVGAKSKIKVYAAMEVDFFPSKEWRNHFERMMKELKADYYIGATHFYRDDNEKDVFSIYYEKENQILIDKKGMDYYIENYWKNVIESIKSGYFAFIAHLDVLKVRGFGTEEKWNDYKFEVIETLAKYNHPYELNTSGLIKSGEQNPHTWMIEELNKRNVPIVISDDAHNIKRVGGEYDIAEKLLADIGYKNRWKFEK